jgi:hypothetical protein
MFSPLMRSKPSPLRRAWFSLVVGGALIAGSVGGLWPCTARAADPTPAPRDWSSNPAIMEVDPPKDVVVYAVGDPHADPARIVDLLVKADLIEVSGQPPQFTDVKWKAGNAVLVCTGDMIDKYENSVEVLQLFMRLQKIAPESGGKVIVTSGNHEAEFLNNPTASNKKAKVFLAQLTGLGVDPQQVANGTDSLGLGQFLRSLPFATRVNDWFFAHAGNTNSKNPDKATKPRSLADLSSFLESDVTKNGYGAAALSESDSILEAKLDSPWWEEPNDSGKDSANRLQKYVTALGTATHPIKHLVIGHQPGKVKFKGDVDRPKGVMANRYLGLIFLIDCGMSRGVDDSTGALLRIRRDDAYSIRFEGNVRKEELLMAQMVK